MNDRARDSAPAIQSTLHKWMAVFPSRWRSHTQRPSTHSPSLQAYGKIALTKVDTIVVWLFRELFNKVQQRILGHGVHLGWTRGPHLVYFFFAGKEAHQNFFIGDTLPAEFLPQFFERSLGSLRVGNFLCSCSIENLVLDIGIHQGGAFFAPHPQCVLNGLICDFLIALAHDDVNGGLASDKLRERSHHDRIAKLGSNSGRFFEGLLDLVLHPDTTQLITQI